MMKISQDLQKLYTIMLSNRYRNIGLEVEWKGNDCVVVTRKGSIRYYFNLTEKGLRYSICFADDLHCFEHQMYK